MYAKSPAECVMLSISINIGYHYYFNLLLKDVETQKPWLRVLRYFVCIGLKERVILGHSLIFRQVSWAPMSFFNSLTQLLAQQTPSLAPSPDHSHCLTQGNVAFSPSRAVIWRYYRCYSAEDNVKFSKWGKNSICHERLGWGCEVWQKWPSTD